MTSKERAETLTASFGRSDWKLLTTEIQRIIDEAVAEAVKVEREFLMSIYNGPDSWTGDEIYAFIRARSTK